MQPRGNKKHTDDELSDVTRIYDFVLMLRKMVPLSEAVRDAMMVWYVANMFRKHNNQDVIGDKKK
jgi:hypothetical protein